VPRLRRFGIRKRNHGDYLILYRVSPDRVRILRIVNGKRDYTALFL
jgi:plasmid stabilization system protein ParE